MKPSETSVPWFNKGTIKPFVFKIAAIVGFLLAFWFLFVGYHAYDLTKVAREIQQQEKIQLDYDWAGTVHRMNADMNAIHVGLSPLYPVFHLFSDRTGFGHLLRQVELFTQFSTDLTKCAATTFNGIQPIFEMLQDKTASTDTGKVIEVLNNHSSSFRTAEELFQSAAGIRPSLDPSILPSSIQKYYEKLDANFEWAGFGLELLQVLPGLAGQDQPKEYLILAQNNDELRATGGFISGIGTIEVAAGKIKKFAIGDSYAVDDFSKSYPIPPMPIERFMLGGVWVPRDGNWSPDFPTAAQNVQDLYALSTDKHTDGVIAFDQSAIRELVGIFEPLTIPSLSTPITADNVIQYMHDAWAPDNPAAINQDWWLHRKDFMKETGSELLRAMIECRNIDQLTALAGAVRNLIRSGHLLVFFNAPDAQSAFQTLDLAGEINFQKNPSFMLVDSNIGFNKMDGVIQRSLDIKLDISDPTQPLATITVDYVNPVKKTVECKHVASYGNGTYADMQARCYWDYWRIYLPAESELISISTPEIPPEWLLNHETVHNPVEVSKGEGDSVVIGGMLVVPTNTTQKIVLKVRLPQQIISPEINGQRLLDLKVYKQPGLISLPINISMMIPSQYTTCQNSSLQFDDATRQISLKETITQILSQNICLAVKH